MVSVSILHTDDQVRLRLGFRVDFSIVKNNGGPRMILLSAYAYTSYRSLLVMSTMSVQDAQDCPERNPDSCYVRRSTHKEPPSSTIRCCEQDVQKRRDRCTRFAERPLRHK